MRVVWVDLRVMLVENARLTEEKRTDAAEARRSPWAGALEQALPHSCPDMMSSEPTIQWMPLTADWDYNELVCREAVAAGVSAIQFSHRICHGTAVLDDPARRDHARKLLKLYTDAGMAVWCWIHEVEKPDLKFVKDGKLQAADPDLYEAIEAKYDKFLAETLPGLSGLILTICETDFEIYMGDKAEGDIGGPERVRGIVDAVAAACRRHGSRLAVRDFLYRKSEVDLLREMFQQLPEDIIVMSKCVPQDWHVFYPPNPMIGDVGNREQWVEHDFGFEHEGQHLYPYADIERIQERLRYEHENGVRTWCLRLDRYNADKGYGALLNPWGRLILRAVKQIIEDPDLELEHVWDDWERQQFIGARTVLNIATETVQSMLFSLGGMTHNHSRIPGYPYARSHIARVDPANRPGDPQTASEKALALAIDGLRRGWANCDRVAGWTDSPEERAAEEAMESMTEECLEACLREADHMKTLALEARECIEAIEDGGAEAEAWERAVEQLVVWAYCFHAWKHAYFHVRRCQEHPSEELAKRCEKLIKTFEETCAEAAPALEGLYLGDAPVCDNGKLAPDVAASLREALACAVP